MSGSHISPESKGISGVSSASGSSSGSAAIAISSSLASSSSSSTSSSCESGIVIGDSFALSLSHSELVGKSKVSHHIDIVDSSPAIKNDTTNSMLSTQLTPKLLNEINMAESLHKLNQAHHHHQMLEPTKVITSLPLSEDPRTLQLALELSLVGLNENRNCYIQPSLPTVPMTMPAPSDFELGSMNVNQGAYTRGDTNLPLPSASGSGLLIPTAGLEDRSKKSQNMTECVPVPSSEHVAEIVGRQGCKIKALRAKTNTYIKTPVRGEEPVFVVTGRKEDVNKAKREILSAADHFSLIRASRKPSIDGHNSGLAGSGNGLGTPTSGGAGGGMVSRLQSGPPCLPGQITIQVRVPYRVVGLVVGPKGATIKHIQQETQTYIVTPSREKEPIFEVTGLPENVEKARKQIEAHIALRTGNGSGSGSSGGDKCHGSENGNDSLESNEFSSLHTINSLTQILNDDLNPDILSSIYKSGISPTVDYSDNTLKVYGNGIAGNGMVNCIDTDELGSVNSTSCSNVTMKSIPGHLIANCFPNSELGDMNMVSMLPAKTGTGSVSGSDIHMQSAKANHLYRNTTTISTNKSLSFCPPTSACASASASASATASASASGANILTRSCSSASSTASTKSTNNSANSTNSVNTPPELLNLWKNLSDSIDIDEGIGDSPSIWNLPPTAAATAHSHCSPTTSVSPTDSLLGLGDHAASTGPSQRIAHQAMESGAQRSVANIITANQLPPNSAADKLIGIHRECFVCNEREVTTALVPCGHNMFCMDCANQICVSVEAMCPVCHSIVYHAMRILG